ncbi:hypothetical protein Cgig2_021590 [Carnegiea gigantea]|uniref:UmuC domain-containing protein n=1 Tax=Carnegiea gigantea TaxID=171969 RepID=A0A9Q1JNJ3_9CARY|nr:hypothetical protein Cgig2_021590 [Carnegiea gigantea]
MAALFGQKTEPLLIAFGSRILPSWNATHLDRDRLRPAFGDERTGAQFHTSTRDLGFAAELKKEEGEEQSEKQRGLNEEDHLLRPVWLVCSARQLDRSARCYSAREGTDVKESVRNWFRRSNVDHKDKLLACGALIVAELRRQVLMETEFTCSAGIAHNKMLAKLASVMNKPAQQTVVPSTSVKEFLGPLPIKKMKQLGGKLGDSLQSDLQVNTVGDLLQFSEQKLQDRYGMNTGFVH